MRAVTELDERDLAILASRLQELDKIEGPRIGDYVHFADGTERRISHIWELATGNTVQTSDSGSWYLGGGYVSFSGSLYRPVRAETLSLVPLESKSASIWFFHHDWQGAGRGVHAAIPARVFLCSEDAPL